MRLSSLRRRVRPLAIFLTVVVLIHKFLSSGSPSSPSALSDDQPQLILKQSAPLRGFLDNGKIVSNDGFHKGYDLNDARNEPGEVTTMNPNRPLGDPRTFVRHGGRDESAQAVQFDVNPEWPETLNGPPTARFKDNLRKDLRYVTGFAPGGWTNDVISMMNLIYLGIIMERVPILPPFAPDHMPEEAGFIKVGDVFDIPGLSEAIGIPVLEWSQVKNLSGARFGDHDLWNGERQGGSGKVEVEPLGCWSTWMTYYSDSGPRPNKHEKFLGLDVSYTSSPDSVKLFPHLQDIHSSFWGLAALGFEEGDNVWKSQRTFKSRGERVYVPPNTQMTCFDYLYFVAASKQIEINHRVSPAWRFVGKHLRWNQLMLDIAHEHIRAGLNLPDEKPLPPHIAVHVRRSDFANMCNGVAKLDCLAPLSAYARRVNEVKAELEAKGLLNPAEDVVVIVTSDEVDPDWWDEVDALGWKRIEFDILGTEWAYGRWYPSLIDAVVQSTGLGLVGTDGSTMSTVAGLRLEDWYGGVWKLVKWGRVGADDH